MQRLIFGLTAALMIAGTAAADIAPPKTKPTASKPKLETEAGHAMSQGQSLMAGAAMTSAVVIGGLMLARRRHPRTSVEV